MTEAKSQIEYTKALEDFRHARAKARLQHLWASITGESKELLQYDEITRKMHAIGGSSKGLKEIPVESIVGSVNRYQDFDKDFLPMRDYDIQRWANVKAMMTTPGGTGLPPIRVYKIGETYFVLDGNHRVSIAREMGLEFLEGYVTEIPTRVPLTPEDSPEDIILKSEYIDFLEETQFDKIIPDVSLELTFPGQYDTLREHIRVHRHFMGLEQYREIPPEEAVRHWYFHVYKPIVDIIREQNILQEFPNLTETDLYLWVLDHQSIMEEEFGWSIRPEKAAIDLVNQKSRGLFKSAIRKIKKFLSKFLPLSENKPLPQMERVIERKEKGEKLFSDILVAMSGEPESWFALEQAIIIASLENADINGLMVRDGSQQPSFSTEDFMVAYEERLNQADVTGKLVEAKGKIADTILARTDVNDLVVLKLMHPPSTNFFKKVSSGMRKILALSTQPVLVVPDQISPLDNFLLAYDGSQKGKEALYIAAYLASRYHKNLSVLVVDHDEQVARDRLNEVEDYLGDCCINFIHRRAFTDVSNTILQVAHNLSADMILMGGYGRPTLLEAFFGSTVNGVLRGTAIPVLICL